ncbi:site-specific integrase [Streptomyces sp. NPDC048442]|uniref:tyrosine-type recombinase/integrase n=1 Tax=Streptomyces sp. NPDC048442 TaxID=3154823 RepID=UPI003428A60E
MASIRERAKRDGTSSFIVLFRAGGARNAKQESEIFEDLKAAESFRDLVNGYGQQWPPGWVRGQGFVAEKRRPATMFEPFALTFIDRLTGIQGDTRGKYKKEVRENLAPWFGPYSVEDGEGGIIRDMVQDWVNDLEHGRPAPLDPPDRKPRTKYKPKTIRDKHGLLFSIMQAAVDAEPPLRASNPCAKTSLPRADGAEEEEDIVFLEREEYAWIYEGLMEDAKELADAIAETGCRWGEATALQPRDLRRRNGRPAVRIQRAWKRDEDGKPVLGPPKTKKSRRTIVITQRLDRVLRRRAKGLAKDALLFTGPEGGKWDPGTFRRLRWLPAIEYAAEKYGLIKRPRIHDLRHSHAAWLIAAKVPLPAIQGRLGHESITTTVDTYGHLLDALDDEVMAAVEWAMNPMAPLPGFLAAAGLHTGAEGLPAVPQQSSGTPQAGWTDASDVSDEPRSPGVETGPVFVVTAAGRKVPFVDEQHAQDFVSQWNDDHAEEIESLRAEGFAASVEKIALLGAIGPERRSKWVGGGPVWTGTPGRELVYSTWATYDAAGEPVSEPTPVEGRWTWEFEHDEFTSKAAEYRVERRPNGYTEVYVRGINRSAVTRAIKLAWAQVADGDENRERPLAVSSAGFAAPPSE